MKKILLSFLFGISFLFLGANMVSANPAGDNIIISEVEYDPAQGGGDQSYEWFELYNPTLTDIDISGWQFTDGEGGTTVVIPNGNTIASGEYFLAVYNTTNFQTEHAGVTHDLEYGSLAYASNVNFSNSGDELWIKDTGGNDVDFVAWEKGGGPSNNKHYPSWNVYASEGESIARANSSDTDTVSDWQGHQAPTPGTGSLTLTDPAMDFVITVKTDNTGSSSDIQFTIPTTGAGYNYNVDCDNDGINEATAQTGNYTCDYGAGNAGTYTIRIKDNSGAGTGFPRIYFNNGGDKDKILSVNQWGTGHWTSMEDAFYGCSNLNSAFVVGGTGEPAWATDVPDFSTVSILDNMFNAATSFNQNINNWDTSNISGMYNMFYAASAFNQPLNNWDVSHVSNMGGMFRDTSAFNQDISGWNTGSVTSMFVMFLGSAFNQDIGSWDTSNVISMGSMFRNASAFNQPLNSWNTVSVTNMASMFSGASAFNQDIGDWDIQDVENMNDMFNNATLSTSNYDALLNAWNAQNLQDSVTFHGGNSTYCAVTAHDNIFSATGHNWALTADGGIDANCPPVITSNGGGNSATIHVNENQTAVTTVTATDPNAGDTLAYGIVGGVDQGKFTIDANTGVLTFQTAPDFENPTDTDTNNDYVVQVQASDGTHADTQVLTVIVDEVSQSSNSSHHGSGRVSKAKLAEIFKKAETKKEEVKEEQNQETKENKCSFTYSRLIRFGTKGEDVKELQETLNALGFNTGVVDGWYGKNTFKGIKAFQTATGIARDGIFGPQSNGKLSLKCSV